MYGCNYALSWFSDLGGYNVVIDYNYEGQKVLKCHYI